jgi:hypothetical protein
MVIWPFPNLSFCPPPLWQSYLECPTCDFGTIRDNPGSLDADIECTQNLSVTNFAMIFSQRVFY